MEASQHSGFYYSVIFSILLIHYINGQYYTNGQYYHPAGKQLQSLLLRLFKDKQSLSTLQDIYKEKQPLSTWQDIYKEKQPVSTRHDDKKYSSYSFEDDDDNMINKPYKGGKYSKQQQTNVPMYSGEYDNTVQSTDGVSFEDKRSSEEEYSDKAVVDILVIVDNSIYKYYLNKHNFNHKKVIRSIKRYYTLLINLIDARYKELELVYPIRIRPASILIMEDKSTFDWSPADYHDWKNEKGDRESAIEPHRALKDLQQWLVNQKHDLPSYDHAMAFTWKKLVKENMLHPSSGMAYVSTICQTDYGYSSSIIGESGGFGNVETASHELGHSLGARHDGNKGNEACPVDLGYIMAPSVSLRENYEHNYFTFSKCSIKAFNEMLNSEQASCLFDSEAPPKPNKLPGQWMSPDRQCKHVFGSTSGECKMSGTQRGEEVCQMLWCKDPHDRYGCITKTGLHAVYGTPCSKGKICYNGKCMEESRISPYHKYKTKSHHSLKGSKKFKYLDTYNKVKAVAKPDYQNSQIVNEDIMDDDVFTEEENEYNEEKFDVVIPKNEIINIDSIFDQSSKVRKPSVIEQTYLARKINLPHKHRGNENMRGKYHKVATTPRSTTTTTKATTTTTTARPQNLLCKDKNARYCRNTVYTNGQHACSVPHIASYCCYSCSFYRR